MPLEPDEVEVSLTVEVSAGIGFVLKKTEWAAMSEDQKKSAISAAVTKAGLQFGDDTIPLEGLCKGYLSMEVLGPTDAEVDLTKISLYSEDD